VVRALLLLESGGRVGVSRKREIVMKAISQILKMVSMASLVVATLAACGKNDGGSNNNNDANPVYALVNGTCTNITTHRSTDQSRCTGSRSYSLQGDTCINDINGRPVSKSYCKVDGYYNGNGGNGGYGCQMDPYTGAQYCQGGNNGGTTNSCYGTYIWYNTTNPYYPAEVFVQCSGMNCAGFTLSDMQGRQINCR